MDVPAAVSALKAKVKAVHEEINITIDFHEAWRPTAYDGDLHARMGKSFATNTFLVVRMALRREMLLALVRLWDRDSNALGMVSIANTLKDRRILDALVTECESSLVDQPVYDCSSDEALTPELKIIVEDYCRRDAFQLAKKQSRFLLSNAEDAVRIISSYAEGGPKHATLKYLKTLRNERLAHRQIVASEASVNPADIKIEDFYQDMLILLHKLLLAVENTHYEPSETAKIKQRHVELFWKASRGECDADHPDYKVPVIYNY
jgi:hypothetical protein